MELSGRHWSLAVGLATALHAGIAYALLLKPPESGTPLAGLGGVEVSLGPAGGTAGSAAAVEAETEADDPAGEVAEAADPPEEASEIAPPEPEAEVVETLPEEQPEPVEAPPLPDLADLVPIPKAEKVEFVEVPDALSLTEATVAALIEPEPEPDVPINEEAPQIVEPEVEENAEAVQPPEPIEFVATEPPAPRRKPVTVQANQPQPVEKTIAEPAAEIPGPVETQTAAVSAAAPGTIGEAGTQSSNDVGSGDGSVGGGMPGASADYIATLQAWLEKHKKYPRRARTRRQEGVVLLSFAMDREGRVLDYRIMESSGYSLLDREVEAMIERAQPFPAMPEDLHEAKLDLVVPIQFYLR